MMGLIGEEGSLAAGFMFKFGIRTKDIRDVLLKNAAASTPLTSQRSERSNDKDKDDQPKQSSLQEFTRDLTEDAAQGKFDPLVGRAAETERLIEIICRRTKNNPVLIG